MERRHAIACLRSITHITTFPIVSAVWYIRLGGVRAGTAGEPRATVPHGAGQGLDLHAAFQCCGHGSMSKIVKPAFQALSPLQSPAQQPSDSGRVPRDSSFLGEGIIQRESALSRQLAAAGAVDKSQPLRHRPSQRRPAGNESFPHRERGQSRAVQPYSV